MEFQPTGKKALTEGIFLEKMSGYIINMMKERMICVVPMTAKEICEAVSGKMLAGDPETIITDICIDSRQAGPGSLFVPIIGEKVDAHKFIAQVLAGDASAVLMSHGDVSYPEKVHIEVTDTVKALGDLAAFYRRKFSMPTIGITGSVGKTSTKEMIAAALEVKYPILKTAGNQNSQIGVPLTLFRMEPSQKLAVIEMGISEYGEMENLVRFVQPDMAVVTNIGEAHIAQFGAKENTAREKLKIAMNFGEGQMLFLNGDDALLRAAAPGQKEKCPVILYGTAADCDYRAEDIHIRDGKNCFTLVCPEGREEIVINQLGIHNVYNALVAIGVAARFGILPKEAKAGLAEYEGIAMRQQINHLRDGIKVIDDTYNASPASVKSGVDVLMQLDNKGRKIAVLGDILELGEISGQCHFDLGMDIGDSGIDEVVTVGREMQALAAGVQRKNPAVIVHSFMSNEEASAYLTENIRGGDAVLVKGSRGMHEEEVVAALRCAFRQEDGNVQDSSC